MKLDLQQHEVSIRSIMILPEMIITIVVTLCEFSIIG